MVPSFEHYHDIFKCLKDEILDEDHRKYVSQMTIKEGDGCYRAYSSMEREGYYELDGRYVQYTNEIDNGYDKDTTYYSSDRDGYY